MAEIRHGEVYMKNVGRGRARRLEPRAKMEGDDRIWKPVIGEFGEVRVGLGGSLVDGGIILDIRGLDRYVNGPKVVGSTEDGRPEIVGYEGNPQVAWTVDRRMRGSRGV